MGRVLIESGTRSRRGVLSASTLIGRHWRCDVPLPEATVPVYWLEIRWSGSQWMWRPLGAEDRTVGRGAVLADQWRALDPGATIRLSPGDVAVELVDDAPPTLVLEDLRTGQRLDGDERWDWVRLDRDGRASPLDDDDSDTSPAALSDGDLLVGGDRLFRVHIPDPWRFTPGARLSIADPTLTATVDLPRRHLVLETDRAEASIDGEAVRVFAAYARLRLTRDRDLVSLSAAPHDTGWATNEVIASLLTEMGRQRSVPPVRINWERHRLRSKLVEAGVADTESLFEQRREGRTCFHRLGLGPDQVQFQA